LALVLLSPGGDALHDEELFPRLDEPEATRLADQLRARPDRRDALLQLRLLGSQRLHLRLPRLQLVLRVQVGVQRPPVEERNQDDAAERDQARRLEPDLPHGGAFSTRDPSPSRVPLVSVLSPWFGDETRPREARERSFVLQRGDS